MLKPLAALGAALLLASSAAAQPDWTPQIDTQGTTMVHYDQDLLECRALAEANPEANGKKQGRKAAKKWGLFTLAGVGAMTVATGGLALVPMMAGGAAVGGGSAAVFGNEVGKREAREKYQGIVSDCLIGRGYHVLGAGAVSDRPR